MCKKKLATKVKYHNLGHKRCHYCCVQLNYAQGFDNSATIEHMIPKSKGGTLAQVNSLVACQKCNKRRGAKDFVGFVTGSRFPRQSWLLSKFRSAEAHYSNMNGVNWI